MLGFGKKNKKKLRTVGSGLHVNRKTRIGWMQRMAIGAFIGWLSRNYGIDIPIDLAIMAVSTLTAITEYYVRPEEKDGVVEEYFGGGVLVSSTPPPKSEEKPPSEKGEDLC